MGYILSIDQGTSGTRAMIFNREGEEVAKSYLEHRQIFPHPGWVEHDALEIWDKTKQVVNESFKKSKISSSEIAAVGITNQRETIVAWDKTTGTPLCNAIVWQCRRTTEYCNMLKQEGYEELFRSKTGLVIDPYFSGTKINWLLDNEEKIIAESEMNGGCFCGAIRFKVKIAPKYSAICYCKYCCLAFGAKYL